MLQINAQAAKDCGAGVPQLGALASTANFGGDGTGGASDVVGQEVHDSLFVLCGRTLIALF